LPEGRVLLKLSTRIVDGVLIVDCAGRLVFGEESASLRDTVKTLIIDKKRLVLNLSGIVFIDSGGLGTLVALYTTAHHNNGQIKLANLTKRVVDLLYLTKLVTVFEVYDSEQQAVDAYKGSAP
jgi:anti-sigma B factor antagonist